MAFQLDARDIPSLGSYGIAYEYWSHQKPWADSTYRPLERHNRKKRHVYIYRGADMSIRCGFHRTDLVVFRPDGYINVELHGSISSRNFINAIVTGPYIDTHTQGEAVVWEHARYWANPMTKGRFVHGDIAVFDKDWQLQNPAPIRWPTINTKKWNAVKKDSGFLAFQTWRKAYEAMGGESERGSSRYTVFHISSYDALDLLASGPAKWSELAAEAPNNFILQALLRANKDVIDVDNVSHFEGQRQWMNWRVLDRKYGWATI